MDTKEIKILAIESSCDETAAAVVVNGRDVRSNVISTQIPLHTLYGGVVPEIASRKHIERINQVIEQALEDADMGLEDMDAIAVTYGPGLVGALLVGVAEAKAILMLTNKQACEVVLKVLNSAVANAEHNNNMDVNNLYVSSCYVTDGIRMKRMLPRAKGRGDVIQKRTCNITIVVAEREAK